MSVDSERERAIGEVVDVLEAGYQPQNPTAMHPADYVTKHFKLDGHENLEDRRRRPDPVHEAARELLRVVDRSGLSDLTWFQREAIEPLRQAFGARG